MSAQITSLSEAVYRQIVENSPVAKIMIGKSGEIVLANLEAERMFGYSRDALLGHPIESLVPTSIRARHPALRDGFFKDPKPRFMGVGRDLAGTRRDGSEFPVEIALSPIKTAAGVETQEQMTFLRDRGCNELQGWLYSPAVEAERIPALMEKWSRAA